MAGEVVIALGWPIENGSETISELNFRRPRAKDLRSFGTEMGVPEILGLAGVLSAQPPSVIDKLDIDDVAQVVKAVEGFFEKFRPAGDKS